MNSGWWESNKDSIGLYLSVAVILCAIGYVIYLCTAPHREPQLQNELHCAQYIYFNPSNKKIDTAYSPIIIYDDSIVSITTPMGKTWFAKDFLENEEREDDNVTIHDITVKDGGRFKVIALDSGRCQSKAAMDSIRDTYNNHEDENDN